MQTMCIEVKKIKENYNYNFSSLKIEEVEKIAESLLSDILENDKAIEPITGNLFATPIVGISQHLGFINYRGSFQNLPDDKKIYRNASGLISINGDNKDEFGSDKILILNVNESLINKRFTIAYEIGRYLFDFDESADFQYEDFYIFDIKDISNSQNTEDEVNTNDSKIKKQIAICFAITILTPKDKFEERYNQLKLKQLNYFEIVNQLSQDFLISTTVIDRRIKKLGLNEEGEE